MRWKLLLADDEPWILKSLCYLFENLKDQYEVVGTAKNGRDALALIHEKKPDIVISDIRMPGLDGLSLLKEAENLEHPPRIILLSGYAEFEYARQALRHNAADYLLKPLNRQDLLRVLGQVSSSARSNFHRMF